MGRKLLLALATAAILVGCGSSSSSPGQSPVTTELSYFPTNTPFVLTVATDPNAGSVQQAQGLIGRFPVAALGLAALEGKLSQVGLSYENDIHPLFGNPIALGAASGSSSATASVSQFLGVWVTKDASALHRLVTKLFGGSPAGTRDGATMYSIGSPLHATLAVNGATALVGTPTTVAAALDRHAHGGGFTSAELAADTAGLPQHTVMEAFGNLTGALSTSSARAIPWVGAIRAYGAAITASSSGINLQFRLDTTGGTLTPQQVPIAAGSTAPSLAGTMPVVAAIHDPAQVFKFAESAEQSSNPTKFSQFLARQTTAKRKLGVDITDLATLLTGDLIIETDTHTTLARATVTDPSAATTILAKLATDPRDLLPKASDLTRLGGGFYTLREGHTPVTFGVVGNQLAAGKGTPAELRAFAAAPTAPATFAHGSVAFRIGLPQLLQIVIKQAPPQVLQAMLERLGDITGWAASSTTALTGAATLAVR
jgi:hypothetical protein